MCAPPPMPPMLMPAAMLPKQRWPLWAAALVGAAAAAALPLLRLQHLAQVSSQQQHQQQQLLICARLYAGERARAALSLVAAWCVHYYYLECAQRGRRVVCASSEIRCEFSERRPLQPAAAAAAMDAAVADSDECAPAGRPSTSSRQHVYRRRPTSIAMRRRGTTTSRHCKCTIMYQSG